MKKGIFTLGLCVSMIGSLSAQVVLSSANMNTNGVIETSLSGKVSNLPPASTFNITTNGTWDLSHLRYDSIFAVTRYSSPVSGYSFADTVDQFFMKTIKYYGQGFNLAVNQGISQWGVAIDPQTMLLQKAGHVDSLMIPTQVPYYSNTYYRMNYPMTYHSVANSSYSYLTAFKFSDAAAGIIRDTGHIRTSVVETDSVLGYGTMKINFNTTIGDTTASALMNVLQCRVRNRKINTYNVGPHTNATLDTLGFSHYLTVDTLVDSLNPPVVDSTPNIDTIPSISTIIVINGIDTTITYDTTYTYDTTGYTYFTVNVMYTYDTTVHYNLSDTMYTYKELFYHPGEITPLVTVLYNDAAFSSIKAIYVNTPLTHDLAVATMPDEYNIAVYPNPVTNGRTYVDIADAGNAKWTYELVNTLGQPVSIGSIASGGGSIHQEIEFNNNLPQGIYYLNVKADGKKAFVKALNIAK